MMSSTHILREIIYTVKLQHIMHLFNLNFFNVYVIKTYSSRVEEKELIMGLKKSEQWHFLTCSTPGVLTGPLTGNAGM